MTDVLFTDNVSFLADYHSDSCQWIRMVNSSHSDESVVLRIKGKATPNAMFGRQYVGGYIASSNIPNNATPTWFQEGPVFFGEYTFDEEFILTNNNASQFILAMSNVVDPHVSVRLSIDQVSVKTKLGWANFPLSQIQQE